MVTNELTRILSLLLLVVGSVSLIRAEERISFNDQIRPILSDRCFKCHGPDAKNQKSEFRLDTQEHAFANLGGMIGIVPGDLDKSEVSYRIHIEAGDDIMPPRKSKMKLTEKEVSLIDQWILQGAEYDEHWAFKPVPASVDVPASDSGWAINEIDHFVEAKLLSNGATPAKPSPKEKWLRRAYFDLTGLPPKIDDIEAFLADTTADAYEKVVDRLLASTAYAERMTSEWQDVARYSDSFGYQRDAIRLAWPWRDWVIGAFAENMSYDKFITLQLAGDLLPDASQETILPTAFNRLHAQKMEGGIVLEEFRVEYVADRTQTFGSAFMGLTIECCRCHDHKYDPLPTKDYYELSAFFANVDESGLISYFTDAVPTPALALSTPEADAALEQAENEIAEINTEFNHFKQAAKQSAEFETWINKRSTEIEWQGMIADMSFDSLADGKYTNAKLPDQPAICNEANSVVPGVSGKAVQFTGDDSLVIPDVGHFAREHPFSASIWIRPAHIADRENIFSRSGGADDAASMGYELLLLDGKVTFSLTHFWPGNSMRVQTKNVVKEKEWCHLAVSYDGSSKASGAQIYLNGKRQELEVVRDGLTREIDNYRGDKKNNRKHIVVGQRYRDRGFKNGQVDEFRLFDRVLTGAEVKQLHDNEYLALLLGRSTDSLSPSQREELFEYFLTTASPPAQEILDNLQAAHTKWNETMDSLPDICVMREMPEPRPTYLLERGVYDSHGEQVYPDTPGVLPAFPQDAPRNRLGLARWLTSPDHPLTARVAVNRYWQLVFGQGLVRTPEDFGSQGSNPTHPQLLDWLARDFVDNGWDLHRLLKIMVLSATYRQSTLIDDTSRLADPENTLLSRSNPDRLTAEMVRDNALSVSGLLVDKVGGEPVKPYDLAVSFKPVKHDKGDGLYRRSLYTLCKRNAPSPAMTVFDASTRDVCTLKREATASPLQPLVLLNGPQFVEAARVLSGKLLNKHQGQIDAIIEEAFLLLTSRRPDSHEMRILTNLYQAQLSDFSQDPKQAIEHLQIGEAPLQKTKDPAKHAAATVLVNAIMNLNESLIQR